MFWNPEAFLFVEESLCTPSIFHAQQLWNRNLLKPLLTMHFIAQRFSSFFRKKAFSNVFHIFYFVLDYRRFHGIVPWHMTVGERNKQEKQTTHTCGCQTIFFPGCRQKNDLLAIIQQRVDLKVAFTGYGNNWKTIIYLINSYLLETENFFANKFIWGEKEYYDLFFPCSLHAT